MQPVKRTSLYCLNVTNRMLLKAALDNDAAYKMCIFLFTLLTHRQNDVVCYIACNAILVIKGYSLGQCLVSQG